MRARGGEILDDKEAYLDRLGFMKVCRRNMRALVADCNSNIASLKLITNGQKLMIMTCGLFH